MGRARATTGHASRRLALGLALTLCACSSPGSLGGGDGAAGGGEDLEVAASSPCEGPQDCATAICVVDFDGRARCSDGMPGSRCNVDYDCVGKCLELRSVMDPQTHVVIGAGVCSVGLAGHPCRRTDDCASGLACVLPAGGGELGTCLAP
jgi:hypothetical protein